MREGGIYYLSAQDLAVGLGVNQAAARDLQMRGGLANRHRTVAHLPASNRLRAIGPIVAERLSYLPTAAMTAAIVLGIDAVALRVRPVVGVRHARGLRMAAATAALLLVGALTARTVARNEDWTSDLRLWTSSESAAPDSIKVHRALAAIAMESDPSGGRADEAIAIATPRFPPRGPAALPEEASHPDPSLPRPCPRLPAIARPGVGVL